MGEGEEGGRRGGAGESFGKGLRSSQRVAHLSSFVNAQSTKTPQEDSFFCKALYNFEAEDEDELSFKAGDVFRVVFAKDPEWWSGVNDGRCSVVIDMES